MAKKNNNASFLYRLYDKTGERYPIIILLILQSISIPLMRFLTSMPAQQNAEFNQTQGISLLIYGSVAILVRNLILFALFSFVNQDMLKSLSKLHLPRKGRIEPEQEKRAWDQATSAAKHYLFYELIGLLAVVIAPTLSYGYFALHISGEQMAYLIMATMSAGLAIFSLENLVLSQLFEPILLALLPRKFETQLAGIKGMRLWVRLSLSILGLVLVSLLLVVPSAFHQLSFIASSKSPSPQLIADAFLAILNSGMGAIVLGTIIAIRLVSYFSDPFRKMKSLFHEVESGDLSRRIDVSRPDEFGSLNININHMISRLQILNSTLERQVTERTEQLNLVNSELQLELAQRKRTEKRLSYNVLHDPLTDLPNRVLFLDRVHHAMDRARRNKDFKFGVIFLDLDRFKEINDNLGHKIGDLLLIENARRLKACLRSQDTVARLGGDEFVILLEDLKSCEDYKVVTNRIHQSLDLPADLEGHKVFFSISMGVVLCDDRYKKPDEMLRDADIAMYRAKTQGRNRCVLFDPTMLVGVIAHLELENDLREALGRHEFVVYYQPIVNLETRRISGFEALLRWQHPTRGLVQAAEFIPTLEEIGLIIPVGYWVLEKACQQLKTWQIQHPSDPPMTVSVNLSARQYAQTDLVQKISEILKKNVLDPGCLKLELAESLIMEDPAFTADILSRLHELGLQIHIDDFGVGYSAQGYLYTLPIDTFKIDRAFIRQLGNTKSGSEIVRLILALAHSLGMKVIAQGVETNDQLSILRSMDCEYMQGFFFAKPVDHLEAGALLEKSFELLKG